MRLVADQRLVVALGVADVLLAVPAIQQRVEELGQVPLLVALLLEELDPVVRHAHRQAVVESDAAFGDRPGHADHSRDVFGDGDRLRIQLRGRVGWPS